MDNALAIIGRPFVALALFLIAAWIGNAILKRMKPGRLRTFLSRPMVVIPRTEAERRDWWPVILPIAAFLVLAIVVWFADPIGHH